MYIRIIFIYIYIYINHDTNVDIVKMLTLIEGKYSNNNKHAEPILTLRTGSKSTVVHFDLRKHQEMFDFDVGINYDIMLTSYFLEHRMFVLLSLGGLTVIEIPAPKPDHPTKTNTPCLCM